MRILITSLPGYGHLCPLIPLANALRDAGHAVAVATSARCSDMLARVGLELLPAGPDWHESDFDHEIDGGTGASGGNSPLLNFLYETVHPPMFEALRAHVHAWQPDIVLSNEYEAVGCTVAELERIPFVLASHSARLTLAQRRHSRDFVTRRVRALAGLPAEGAADYAMRWLHLNFTHPDFAVAPSEVTEAANEYSLRAEIHDDFGDPLPDIGHARPTVLCTHGTVYNNNPEILGAIVDACAGQPYRVLLTGGPAFDALSGSSLPDNIAVYPYLPLSRVLPHVDACVTHGGSATLHAILRHGRPSLLIPQGPDHIANGLVCQRLELCRIAVAEAFRGELNGGRENLVASIRGQIRQVLGNPAFRDNCARFRDELLQLPGLPRAVELIEKLHLTGMPVLKT